MTKEIITTAAGLAGLLQQQRQAFNAAGAVGAAERKRRIHVRFGVAYGSDKERVREAALAAARSVEGLIIDQQHAAEVWLVNFGDSSLDFELVVWAGHALMMAPARAQALCLWALETELARHHIEIPFPQRDLHIRSGVLKVEPSAPVASTVPSAS